MEETESLEQANSKSVRESVSKCSECSEPLDTTGKPKWCKRCRAKYQRDYQSTRSDRTFLAGVNALRVQLAREFERLGSGYFTGTEVAKLILRTKAPTELLD